MTETEVVEFFTKLRAIPAQFSRENYLACALLIATCTRKMELLAAPWHEFDLPNRVWHLPKNAPRNVAQSTFLSVMQPYCGWKS